MPRARPGSVTVIHDDNNTTWHVLGKVCLVSTIIRLMMPQSTMVALILTWNVSQGVVSVNHDEDMTHVSQGVLYQPS